MSRYAARIAQSVLLAALFVDPTRSLAAEYTLPERVKVLPVAFVPSDEKPPTKEQQGLFLKHLRWTNARYAELLQGDTFEFARDDVVSVKGRRPLDYYRQATERGAPDIVAELLTHFKVTRFSCPYVFAILLMNSRDSFPEGGGRPINGGANSGGGMFYISSFELQRNEHFQCTLQHELGHSFGLPHVDVYGYDMQRNASLMSYNPAHHNRGFDPSPTPGIFIPEDLRILAMNDRAFAQLTFKADQNVPASYSLSPRIVTLGPMNLPGMPDYYPTVTGTGGEFLYSKYQNVVSQEIKPSAGPGITYDPSTMWHSDRLPDGQAVLEIRYPWPVRLTALAIHSQHSGIDHHVTHAKLEAVSAEGRQTAFDRPVNVISARIDFPEQVSDRWSLTLTASPSQFLVIRGLQFFDDETEICPHQVPYAPAPPGLAAQAAQEPQAKPVPATGPEPVEDQLDERLEIPAAAELQQARKEVRARHKSDFAKATKPQSRFDLAQNLLRESDKPESPELGYALLMEALDLATQAREVNLLLTISDTVGQRYQADAIALKEQYLSKVNTTGLSAEDADTLLEAFLQVAREATANENYALAVTVLQSAANAFRKPVFLPQRELAQKLARQAIAFRDAFEQAVPAQEKLKQDPENAAASLTWGKFLCFYKQDWDQGLPVLARGMDRTWAPLAERELAGESEITALMKLGDDWLRAGDKEKDPVRYSSLQHADQAWSHAITAASADQLPGLLQQLDGRFLKLFGSTFVATNDKQEGFPLRGTEKYSPVTEEFTLEFWVSTSSERGTLIAKRQTRAEITILIHLDSGAPSLGIAHPGGEGGVPGSVPVNDGLWHHVALVKQESSYTLYVDGRRGAQMNDERQLVSNAPWRFGASFSREAGTARFGGLRISRSARYKADFTPVKIHAPDQLTLYP